MKIYWVGWFLYKLVVLYGMSTGLTSFFRGEYKPVALGVRVYIFCVSCLEGREAVAKP